MRISTSMSLGLAAATLTLPATAMAGERSVRPGDSLVSADSKGRRGPPSGLSKLFDRLFDRDHDGPGRGWGHGGHGPGNGHGNGHGHGHGNGHGHGHGDDDDPCSP